MTLLELAKSDPVLDVHVNHNKPLVDEPGSVQLLVPQLELDVGQPRLLLRLPLHPPLVHGAAARYVAEHLLHVGVLVPELVSSGQDGDGSIPEVPRVVHLLVPHLHLGILQNWLARGRMVTALSQRFLAWFTCLFLISIS